LNYQKIWSEGVRRININGAVGKEIIVYIGVAHKKANINNNLTDRSFLLGLYLYSTL